MTDAPPAKKKHSLRTRLSHAGRPGTHVQGFVNPGVMRGSTVLQPDIATRKAAGAKRLEQAWIYGTAGGPTHWALEDMIAEIEGGTRCQIVSTGLAAVTTPLDGLANVISASSAGPLPVLAAATSIAYTAAATVAAVSPPTEEYVIDLPLMVAMYVVPMELGAVNV